MNEATMCTLKTFVILQIILLVHYLHTSRILEHRQRYRSLHSIQFKYKRHII